MQNNNSKTLNLYTQGQRLAVRVLLMAVISGGSIPSLLATKTATGPSRLALLLLLGSFGPLGNSLQLQESLANGVRAMFEPEEENIALPDECVAALKNLGEERSKRFSYLMSNITSQVQSQVTEQPVCVQVPIRCEDLPGSQCHVEGICPKIEWMYAAIIKYLLNGGCNKVIGEQVAQNTTVNVRYHCNKQPTSTLTISYNAQEKQYNVDAATHEQVCNNS